MPTPIAERGAIDAATFAAEVADAYRPVVLRGQVAAWPAVRAAHDGPAAIADYIAGFDSGSSADVLAGPADIDGRFFYNADVTGFNFERGTVPLRDLLAELVRMVNQPHPPALYAGAAAAEQHLPGWEAANSLGLPTPGGKAKIWIGNRTRVSTHYDVSSNIACVVAGRRRFTLFPPEQIRNLYVGPLEFTLAGQPTSMVDLDAPDFDRYPRFAEALDQAQSAELEAGDAIFIPSLWWHNVAALAPFNVLVNYWWGQANETPAFAALVHALLSIRDVAPGERAAWRDWFDHYVFGPDAHAAADHLPAAARGVLASASLGRTEQLKRYLLRSLERR